jgi:hypothetical protein
MARANGAPEFLRRNAATDLGKPDYAVDLDEQRIEPQLGPDEYGKRHSQVERDLIAGMDKLTSEIRRDPLREIAMKTRALTYGEMMDYVAAIMGSEDYKAPTTAYEFAGMMDAWCKRTLLNGAT